MVKHEFEALGTKFAFTFFEGGEDELRALALVCEKLVRMFDAQYSRFKSDSLVSVLSKQTGVVEVPSDLVSMLRLYQKLNAATGGKINPLVGAALEDVGYDAAYTLHAKEVVRSVPALSTALTIIDDTHIELHENVVIDLGAVGKGFVIDQVYEVVRAAGVNRFLIDGSGDIRYAGDGESIVCGLEDSRDAESVIGTLPLSGGALCASAINRRAWGTHNHYIDPDTGVSPTDISAVWVTAETAVHADGLSSALFFVEPEALDAFSFEYLVVNKDMGIKKSAGFAADLFTK